MPPYTASAGKGIRLIPQLLGCGFDADRTFVWASVPGNYGWLRPGERVLETVVVGLQRASGRAFFGNAGIITSGESLRNRSNSIQGINKTG